MEASALRRTRAGVLPRSRRLLSALGDDRLVEQIRRGNTTAFEVLYDRHYRGILSFCRHMLGSRDEAEDAVQQTFASVFTDLQSNRREIRLKAWLYTIARNRCLSMLRARREQPSEIDEIPTAGLSDQVQQRVDLQELLHDLRELPEEQREALVLFELGDLSQAEVADVIGVEPVKVKALVFQARTALIENREAREIPCSEIREQLATATGGALRRGPLRRHLKACEGCREFRDQVKAQRRALAALLPVLPSAGLKSSVLAAIGIGGGTGGGGLIAGGGATGGGLFASVGGGASVAKMAVAGTLGLGAIAGGGIAVERAVKSDGGPTAQASEQQQSSGAPSGGNGSQQPGSPSLISNGSPGGTPSGAVSTGTRDEHGRRGDHKSHDGKSDDSDASDEGTTSDDTKTNNRQGNSHSGGTKGGHGNSGHGSNPGNGPKPGKGPKPPTGPKGPKPPRGNGNGNNGNANGNHGNANGNRGNGNGNGNHGNGNGNGGSQTAQTVPPVDPGSSGGNKGGRGTASTTTTPPPGVPADSGDKAGKDRVLQAVAPLVPPAS
jgi:RNA polymerase sigma factor (sigma-70 family)